MHHLTLWDMVWKQGTTDIYVYNIMAHGIANQSVSQQRSCAINMQNLWIIDQVDMGTFCVLWTPGLESLADYFMRHDSPAPSEGMPILSTYRYLTMVSP